VSKWRADRLDQLPPYLFVEIDRKKREARQAGRDVIDLGVGDPDQPTPSFIVERMAEALTHPENHRYALGIGSPDFRRAVAAFFQGRFGVSVDPDREVVALLGSKEGIGHLPTAVVNPGQTVLVPSPGYPVYTSGSIFAGAKVHRMPLSERNGWLPVLEDIPVAILRQSRLMFLNYPNNPTAACADLAFFERAVAFARRHGLLIAQDAAYTELHMGAPPPSILQVPGAADVAIELHSLSKTFNMTGWRVGFAVGNADALASLAAVKSNLDSGVFGAIQAAAAEAIQHTDHVEVRALLDMYRRRRDALVSGLREGGWSVAEPQATFYVWVACPGGRDSLSVARRILEEQSVVVIPGIGFGAEGEGYVRMALTVEKSRLAEAARRIAAIRW
jgi:LL-diaminopimelate aminotransferase